MIFLNIFHAFPQVLADSAEQKRGEKKAERAGGVENGGRRAGTVLFPSLVDDAQSLWRVEQRKRVASGE